MNPFLKKLGLSEDARAVIIHTDDIGMYHASVQAFKDLWTFGTITSGAVMVPCPWFPAVAQMCRENPEIDMGVHTTLNAEWESYRWGPVSNYNTFMSDELKKFIVAEDIKLMGYRQICEAMRKG